MAKKVFTHSFDKNGKPIAVEVVKATKAQRKSTETLIPQTTTSKRRAKALDPFAARPTQTRWQKFKHDAWG